ncbi:MAG: hypothetical protein Q4D38_13345 [Planctomycetia bacterium]|nr:hypothetical protein [Planctomycetia bacterium]
MFLRLVLIFARVLVSVFIGATAWGGELKILSPPNAEPAYRIAGEEFQKYYEKMTGVSLPLVSESNAEEIFRALSQIHWNDPFLRRDTIDLARTTATKKADAFIALAEGMRDILALHEDYSLYETWERCNAIEPIQNPNFGWVLLDNASCHYCRSHQYELMDRWYLPVVREIAGSVKEYVSGERKDTFARPKDFSQKRAMFYNTSR